MATKVTIYVPQTVRETLDVRDQVKTLRWIAGGMSEHRIEGSWVSPTQGVVTEPVKVLAFILDNPEPAKRATFDAGIDNLITFMHEQGEESVLIEETEVKVRFA